MKTVSFYVAFSVHGTNTFITASRKVPASEAASFLQTLETKGFTSMASRRTDFNRAKEVKLHWRKLMTEAGLPYKSPPWIIRRFKELATDGWTIDNKKFIERHFKHVHTDSVSR